MASYSFTFDKTVFDDEALTSEAAGPFNVKSSIRLPKGIYYTASTVYVGTAKNDAGDTLYTVTFNSTDHLVAHPDDAAIKVIDKDLGAVYS